MKRSKIVELLLTGEKFQARRFLLGTNLVLSSIISTVKLVPAYARPIQLKTWNILQCIQLSELTKPNYVGITNNKTLSFLISDKVFGERHTFGA